MAAEVLARTASFRNNRAESPSGRRGTSGRHAADHTDAGELANARHERNKPTLAPKRSQNLCTCFVPAGGTSSDSIGFWRFRSGLSCCQTAFSHERIPLPPPILRFARVAARAAFRLRATLAALGVNPSAQRTLRLHAPARHLAVAVLPATWHSGQRHATSCATRLTR